MANHGTVLVVDDNEEILNLAAFALELAGYNVQRARHGRAALEVIEHAMPALVLLDLTMPVMDGCEFAREFHSRYDSLTPIVVFSGEPDARGRAREIGAVDCLSKPFKLSDLLSVVERHVGVTGPTSSTVGARASLH